MRKTLLVLTIVITLVFGMLGQALNEKSALPTQTSHSPTSDLSYPGFECKGTKDIKIDKNLQTIFFISVVSNIGFSQYGTQKNLQKNISIEIKNVLELSLIKYLFGQWEVVWGAGVFQSQLSEKTKKQADNVMFVAKKEPIRAGDRAQYVISIAGSLTFYDYIIEDFWVAETVPWTYGPIQSKKNPRISLGTQIGLANLLGMAPGNVKLVEFLKKITSEANEKIDVIVAGHSLGGALAYTLALYLVDTQDKWDANSKATVYSVPSAAPAIGSRDFAAYYDQRLGSQTTRIWNSIDMIPHLWNKACLQQIPDLYLPEYPAGLPGCLMTELAIEMSKDTDYLPIQHDSRGLPGKVHDFPPSFCKSLEFTDFMKQVGFQHTFEYFFLLFLPPHRDNLLEIPQIKDMFEHLQSKISPEDKDFNEFIRKLSGFKPIIE